MRLRFESLEQRQLFAADWQNATDYFDVDLSGVVQPLDALVVINDINQFGARDLAAKPTDYSGPLVDVSGDGNVAPLDALMVINHLNALPQVGSVAPAVKLTNQDGELVDLTSYIGKNPVVLYFYPKDNTAGCTIEALDFRDRYDEIEALGAKVFGVSLDAVDSHQTFSSQHQLNFDILSDVDKQVSTAYGVLSVSNGLPIAKRTTFIIGIDGTIRASFTDVNVRIHGQQVVDALKAGVAV